METIALSLSKGSSSWAREDQPSSRKRHLLRPEKMTLSGIAKCEYGLGDGDQRLLADQKASYKRKKKISEFGETATTGTCSQDVSVGLPGHGMCITFFLSLPLLQGSSLFLSAPCLLPSASSLLAPGSHVPQGPLDLPTHQLISIFPSTNSGFPLW